MVTSERYPDWWSTTITIFNRFEDTKTQQVTWFKTVVPKCFWKDISGRALFGNATAETDSIICRIPKQINFLEAYIWVDKPYSEKSSYFTLNSGDIIIRGNITDDINEYQKGQRATDILDKYALRGSLRIDSFAVNAGPGLGQEHYYVRGI